MMKILNPLPGAVAPDPDVWRGGRTLTPVAPDDYPHRAPFPMCFTSEAAAALLDTVGARPPESGAKGWAPADKFGFETIEFDRLGSSGASGSIYSPDTAWGNERCDHYLDQPEGQIRLWTGDLHSHPGDFCYPSGKSGRGLGDLGYVEEVFAQNDWIEFFLLPILIRTGPGAREVGIAPWVITRSDPRRPLLADFAVCPVERFPNRVFSPAWQADADATEGAPIAVARLAQLLAAPVERRSSRRASRFHVEVALSACTLILALPEGFPQRAPELILKASPYHTVPCRFPFRWRTGAEGVDTDLERRLAVLCLAANEWMAKPF